MSGGAYTGRGPRPPGKRCGERKILDSPRSKPVRGQAAETTQPARPPLLYLDVDGVINACDPDLRVETIEREGFDIRFQPWLRECLLRLHEHFEVVWCTTWRDMAEPCFAEVLGLPGTRDYVRWDRMKLPSLVLHAGDRPWAFVDDDAKWELENLRDVNIRGGFIVVPDTTVGLTREHTSALVAYAEGLC